MTMQGEVVTFGWARFSVFGSWPSEVPSEVCTSKFKKLPDSDMATHNLVHGFDP